MILYHYLREADIAAVITNKKLGDGPLLSILSEFKDIKFEEVRCAFVYRRKEIQEIYLKTLNRIFYRDRSSFLKIQEYFKDFIYRYEFLISNFYKENILCKSTMEYNENIDGLKISHLDYYDLILKESRKNQIFVVHDSSGVTTTNFFIYESPNNKNLKFIVNRNDFPSGVSENFDFSFDAFGTSALEVQPSFRNMVSIIENPNFPKTFKDLVTLDPEMLHLINFAEFISNVSGNILLLGETGTGKDVFARAIHESSSRKDKPFVPINCAAIPKELFESEMFGIKKRTATNVDEKIGKFEEANKGTLFLDEIGELPIEFQSKILRVLQDKCITMIGSNKNIKLDFRLICATNKNLSEVLDKEFRSDLYYRINSIIIKLPALRERVDSDIEILLEYFLSGEKINNPKFEDIKIEETVVNKLKKYNWPGNIRELQGFVQKAFTLAAFMSKDIDEEILYRTLEVKDFDNEDNFELKEVEMIKEEKNIEKMYEDLFSVNVFDGFNMNDFIKTIQKEYLKKVSLPGRTQTEIGKILGFSQPQIANLFKKFNIRS